MSRASLGPLRSSWPPTVRGKKCHRALRAFCPFIQGPALLMAQDSATTATRLAPGMQDSKVPDFYLCGVGGSEQSSLSGKSRSPWKTVSPYSRFSVKLPSGLQVTIFLAPVWAQLPISVCKLTTRHQTPDAPQIWDPRVHCHKDEDDDGAATLPMFSVLSYMVSTGCTWLRGT